jgi:MFS family permease
MSANVDRAAPPDTAAAALPRAGAGFLLAYGLAYFGLYVALFPPVIATLQIKVEQVAPASKENSLAIVLGVGALLGIIANPIIGRLSDRTTARWGMRRPWLLGCVLVGLAGLVILGVGNSVAAMVAGWSVCFVAYNGMLAVLMSVLADQVRPDQRGMVSGLLGLCQAIATVIGVGLATGISQQTKVGMFVVPGAISVLACVFLLVALKDRRLDKADRPPFGFGALLRSYTLNPRRNPDFAWAFVSRFLIFMAIGAILTYQVFFLSDRFPDWDAERVNQVLLFGVFAQTGAIALSVNLVGWLSDKLGRRRIFVAVSATIAGIGLLVLTQVHSLLPYLVAMVVIGVGQGTYFAVDLALITDVLPDRELDAAKDLGVMNVATTLPQSLSPALAPAFLAIGAVGSAKNYDALFIGGMAFAVLSALAVLRVRRAR